MHSSCTDRPIYTGAQMFRFAPPFGGPIMGHHPQHELHGFCHSCCHPRSHCMCVRRECRKEARELMVKSDTATAKPADIKIGSATAFIGSATAFIGGGCCVHLSVEYMADLPTLGSHIIVMVDDSEGTTLVWARNEPAGVHYQIKEGIVTTKPGAKLKVIVSNATARVRWCEIFSC